MTSWWEYCHSELSEESCVNEEEKKKFVDVPNPEKDSDFSVEQRNKASSLTELNTRISEYETQISVNTKKLAAIKIELSETEKLLLEITTTRDKFESWKKEMEQENEKDEKEFEKVEQERKEVGKWDC